MINSYIPIIAIIDPKNQEAISSNDLLAGLVSIILLSFCITGLIKALRDD